MKSITPLLYVEDMIESLAFYQVLGFDIEQRMPEEGDPTWAYMVCGSVHLMLQETEEKLASQRMERELEQDLVLHMGHEDVIEFYGVLVEHGVAVSEISDSDLPEFTLQDPDGYTLVFFLDEG
jgi:catechol 2,3-dioxygenase-like lactoylglutathione lyase family enzyme